MTDHDGRTGHVSPRAATPGPGGSTGPPGFHTHPGSDMPELVTSPKGSLNGRDWTAIGVKAGQLIIAVLGSVEVLNALGAIQVTPGTYASLILSILTATAQWAWHRRNLGAPAEADDVPHFTVNRGPRDSSEWERQTP